jgi:effector-binding domain-containing protein
MDEPQVRTLAEQPCVAVRIARPMAGIDIGTLVGEHLGPLFASMAPTGVALGGAPYVRYHDWGGDTAIIEIGFPVKGSVPSGVPPLADVADGQPGASRLPGGRAMVAVHRGPYSGLMTAWREADGWMVEHAIGSGGAPWESYVDNPDTVDPSELRTEIVWPIAAE